MKGCRKENIEYLPAEVLWQVEQGILNVERI
jgi:hypothetical protein